MGISINTFYLELMLLARLLRMKQARDVAEMIADIYKVGIFQCDNGGEFKGEVTKMLEKQEVKIR